MFSKLCSFKDIYLCGTKIGTEKELPYLRDMQGINFSMTSSWSFKDSHFLGLQHFKLKNYSN